MINVLFIGRGLLLSIILGGIAMCFAPSPATRYAHLTTINSQLLTFKPARATGNPHLTNPSPSFGIIYSLSSDSLLHAKGYEYLEESVQGILSPFRVDRKQFTEHLRTLKQARCRVVACNLFIPAELKLVGPLVEESKILAYADSVFRRAREAGIGIIVLGSGGARRIPQGFDSLAARLQLITLLKKMAPLAAASNVVVAMENLNRGECNLGNTLEEVTGFIREVNHPNIRVTADIYHMLKEDEGPESIRAAGDLLVHCHIAEERERARPGMYGEDFKPYFRALRDSRFSGRIMMECGWTDIYVEAKPALEYLKRQWGE